MMRRSALLRYVALGTMAVALGTICTRPDWGPPGDGGPDDANAGHIDCVRRPDHPHCRGRTPTWTPIRAPTAHPTASVLATSIARTPVRATATVPPAFTSAPTMTQSPASPVPSSTPSPSPDPCDGIPAYPEFRSANTPYNRTAWPRPVWAIPAGSAWDSWRPYYERVGSGCYGTTRQLIEWAATSWGVPTDLALALAWNESGWNQEARGDFHAGGCNQDGQCFPDNDDQSYGMIQIKRTIWPYSWEGSRASTSWALMYGFGIMRWGFDRWGNWDDVLEAYYWGSPNTPEGEAYRDKIRAIEGAKPWCAYPGGGC
jgi:hypothetical protein